MKALLVETNRACRDLERAPAQVLVSYEVWARLIEEHGAGILRSFGGYHDEKLSGRLSTFRSSRLNRKWRVIYRSDSDKRLEVITIERVTAHDYRSR